MQSFAKSLLFCASLSLATLASAQVTTDVYSGYSPSGDGSPFSGLVGSLSTPDILFGTSTHWNWHPFGLSSFGARSHGMLNVSSAGNYTFKLTSDDGSALFIDGLQSLNNGGAHSPTPVVGTVSLGAGLHAFNVDFFEGFGGASGLDLRLPVGVTFTSPVPEPDRAALTLAGLGALGLVWRRRRSRT